MTRRGTVFLGAAPVLLLAGALLLAGPIGRGYDALLLLGDITGQPLPAAVDHRPSPQHRGLVFENAGRRHQADLYRPSGPAAAGIVLVPGAAPMGKDDPRVVDFAKALARARFAVLVPDVVALRELRLLPESADDIADALAWLGAQPGLAPGGRVGIVTTSVAIGPSVLAIIEPPLSASVRFVVSIGGYHDLPRTLGYLTTGHYEADGVAFTRTPNDYGKWVYALSNAIRLERPDERAAFEALAWRKLRDPAADVAAEVARLGPDGRAVYAFLVNRDPARSAALLRALPARLRADTAALDLSSQDLSAVEARFILVHGVDDDLIPWPESRSLAAALAPGQAQVFVLAGFGHVDVGPQLRDGWRMFQAVYALLGERAS